MTVLLQFDDSSLRAVAGAACSHTVKIEPIADRAGDLEPAAMAVEDVLDDREAEPGAAQFARAGGVDAVEALGQARQVLAGNALALVA